MLRDIRLYEFQRLKTDQIQENIKKVETKTDAIETKIDIMIKVHNRIERAMKRRTEKDTANQNVVKHFLSIIVFLLFLIIFLKAV